MRNKEGLYLPPLKIEGDYVTNHSEIIKAMKVNHPNLGNASLGSHVKEAKDLKHGENFIHKWKNSIGASSRIFVPFYESFAKTSGYQTLVENEIVSEPETYEILSVKRRCRDNSRVVFTGDKEAVIPTSCAREGSYIRRDHLRQKGDVYYYYAPNQQCG